MNFSRRQMFQSAAALAMAPALVRAQAAPRPKAVVLIYLNGGYNALFGSAKSFSAAGTFGVTPTNIKQLGGSTSQLFVDDATFGQLLPASALGHLATVGVNHHISAHTPAQMSHWIGPSGRSNALMLAKSMAVAGSATLPCVVVGPGTPVGTHPAEGGVTLQRASDLAPALDLFGVGSTAGAMPSRRTALAGLRAAKAQSAASLTSSPNTLKSAREAYDGALAVMTSTAPGITLSSLQAFYGVTGTAVSSFTHQMMAADAMISLGTKVVVAVSNAGWDTHGDINGIAVRNKMSTLILPGLSKFLSNASGANATHDVTVAIFGDFARSLPGSDHASCVAATVIGPRIKVGTTGNVDPQVGMSSTPGPAGMWSLLADASGVPAAANPFGANPHASLLL
ncbi:MAG: DUF1501 domain-containing protein [Archangiaceae bacterium]|nr:DUF1501 domain-containing protein [Archangiaceae bacterium]